MESSLVSYMYYEETQKCAERAQKVMISNKAIMGSKLLPISASTAPSCLQLVSIKHLGTKTQRARFQVIANLISEGLVANLGLNFVPTTRRIMLMDGSFSECMVDVDEVPILCDDTKVAIGFF